MLVLAFWAALATSARAGTYVVTDLGAFTPFNSQRLVLDTYPSGGLVARNVQFSSPDFRAANGANAGWRIGAPANSSLTNYQLDLADVVTSEGWAVMGQVEGGDPVFSCGFGGTTACSSNWSPAGTVGGGSGLITRVICVPDSCPLSGIRGQFRMTSATVSVLHNAPPTVSITGGSLVTNKWVGGQETLGIAATDDVGISQVRTVVDGVPRGSVDLPCKLGALLPCSNTSGQEVQTDLAGLSDGSHQLQAVGVDAASNPAGTTTRSILVDNTSPVSPQNLALEGGPGWRSANGFTVRWVNPPQSYAPIAGANWQLCPVGRTTGCRSGTIVAADVQGIDRLDMPERGLWTLRVWLTDAAGNADSDSSAIVENLGFDDTPPSASIAHTRRSDPARITVNAADPESGITAGSIEVRRRGGRTWRRLSTRTSSGSLTTVIPDRRLPPGRYAVRAIATNAAGLSVAASSKQLLRLPIRRPSRLTGGKPSGRRLLRSPSPRIGQATPLRGRLTSRGRPLANRAITVLSRVDAQGARLLREGTVRTDGRGRYRYRVRPSTARIIRLVYAGGPKIADSQTDVRVRVRSRVSLRIDRRRVRNGESVTLAGRVQGGQLPPEGVQMALQVFTRGKWRPFETPRTDAAGRFSLPYRFETVLGTARFRFRAVVLKGPTYPFYGQSPARRVTVRGL